MKKLVVLITFAFVSGSFASFEYGHFYRASKEADWNQSVTLLENEALIIMNDDNVPQFGDQYTQLWCDYGGGQITRQLKIWYTDGTRTYSPEDSRTITGPCVITPRPIDEETVIDYKIARASINTSPMNIISLPGDNNGDVDLLVESSLDLITWSPVYSGSAGTSNSAAFFRTRLIKN